MPDFRKVSPGDPVSRSPARKAAWLNAVSESAAHYHDHIAAGQAGSDRALKTSSGLVKVKNLTGSNLLRGHYVQLGTYLLNKREIQKPDNENETYKAVDPDHIWLEGNLYDGSADGRIAIVTAALSEGKIGSARALGICTALVNVTDISHRFAEASDGEYVLQSAASGAVEILSDVTETGEQEVAVLLGGGSGAAEEHYVLVLAAVPVPAASGTTPGVLTALAGSGGGAIGVFKATGDNDYEEVLAGATLSILNPWEYAAGAGFYPLKRVDGNTFIIDGFDITGHLNWVTGDDQVFIHYADQDPQWEDASVLAGEQGPQGETGPQGPAGNDGAPGADGDQISEGYCFELDGADPNFTGHVDMITAAAGVQATGINTAAFQFWIHLAGANSRDDAQWTTVTGYDNTKTQLLGQINGTWHAKTIVDWLELVDGYAAGSDQILGHLGGGEIEWKTITSKVINSVTGFGLNLDADSLDGNVNYTPVTVKVWPAASDGGGASFDDTVPVDDCTA